MDTLINLLVYLEYIETKKDDDIIVFVDGFDTKINKDISNVKSLFESYECKVLVSKDPELMNKFGEIFVFGNCNNSERSKCWYVHGLC